MCTVETNLYSTLVLLQMRLEKGGEILSILPHHKCHRVSHLKCLSSFSIVGIVHKRMDPRKAFEGMILKRHSNKFGKDRKLFYLTSVQRS